MANLKKTYILIIILILLIIVSVSLLLKYFSNKDTKENCKNPWCWYNDSGTGGAKQFLKKTSTSVVKFGKDTKRVMIGAGKSFKQNSNKLTFRFDHDNVVTTFTYNVTTVPGKMGRVYRWAGKELHDDAIHFKHWVGDTGSGGAEAFLRKSSDLFDVADDLVRQLQKCGTSDLGCHKLLENWLTDPGSGGAKNALHSLEDIVKTNAKDFYNNPRKYINDHKVAILSVLTEISCIAKSVGDVGLTVGIITGQPEVIGPAYVTSKLFVHLCNLGTAAISTYKCLEHRSDDHRKPAFSEQDLNNFVKEKCKYYDQGIVDDIGPHEENLTKCLLKTGLNLFNSYISSACLAKHAPRSLRKYIPLSIKEGVTYKASSAFDFVKVEAQKALFIHISSKFMGVNPAKSDLPLPRLATQFKDVKKRTTVISTYVIICNKGKSKDYEIHELGHNLEHELPHLKFCHIENNSVAAQKKFGVAYSPLFKDNARACSDSRLHYNFRTRFHDSERYYCRQDVPNNKQRCAKSCWGSGLLKEQLSYKKSLKDSVFCRDINKDDSYYKGCSDGRLKKYQQFYCRVHVYNPESKSIKKYKQKCSKSCCENGYLQDQVDYRQEKAYQKKHTVAPRRSVDENDR